MVGKCVFTNDEVFWEYSRALFRPHFALGQINDLGRGEHGDTLYDTYIQGLVYDVPDTLQNKPGLLSTVTPMCEHCHPELCSGLEKVFLFMPSAISDSTGGFWRNTSIPRPAKSHFLNESLEGLKVSHAMGIMHRDIRSKNMLIISKDPPRAALGDYGKAVEAKTSHLTTIGPIHTLAPTVKTVATDGPYMAKKRHVRLRVRNAE